MSKNLVLIAESFPPVNNMAAQRFPPMLPVLEAHGWRTWVITQNASGPLPVRLPEERIIRIGQHYQRGLKHRTDSKGFLGGDSSVRTMLRSTRRLNLDLTAADGSLLTWGRPLLQHLTVVRERLPVQLDVIIGTFQPVAPLWFASRMATLYRCPWIADYRDPPALRRSNRPSFVQALDRFIESRLLRTAAVATTVGKHWATLLTERCGVEFHVVYNGWDDTDHFVPTPDSLSWPHESIAAKDNPSLYYAGQLRARHLEPIRRILLAIVGTPFKLIIRSLGPVEYEQLVLRHADEINVRGQVRLLETAPHYVAREEAKSATANLVIEDVATEQEWNRGHLGGKFLQLLPLEPPVIFVGRPDAEAGEILARTGKGALCTTVEEIREQLHRLEAGRFPAADQAAVFAFSKTRQGEKLLEVIEGVRAQARAGSASVPATGRSIRVRS